MPPVIRARSDPDLKARIVGHSPLYYQDNAGYPGSAADGDRPAYVRAGSSLAYLAQYLTVVQDNANFVALIDLDGRRASALPLPAGPGGQRVFDAAHDNKQDKMDLEACLSLPVDSGALLVALGSGSKPQREQIVVIRWRGGEQAQPQVSVHEGAAFYAMLRQAHAFAGSALNVEGAVYLGQDRIRLFQRGNGAPRDGLQPVDATGDLAWSALWQHLQQPGSTPPSLENIVQYDLGNLHGQRLGFSDAEAVAGAILYSASAEASPSSDQDGAIQGSVLGVLDAGGSRARYTTLITENGEPFLEKIEGLSIERTDPYRAYFVVDDDKDQPTELFEVDLSGPWYGASG
jgi:hypothetical protein